MEWYWNREIIYKNEPSSKRWWGLFSKKPRLPRKQNNKAVQCCVPVCRHILCRFPERTLVSSAEYSKRWKKRNGGTFFKKGVDKRGMMWYNNWAFSERAGKRQTVSERWESRTKPRSKNLKKLKKVLKNLLTNESECDIINKPTERKQQGAQKQPSLLNQKSAKSPKLIENWTTRQLNFLNRKIKETPKDSFEFFKK